MSWKTGNHACFLMLSALLLITPAAVLAENSAPFTSVERVVSVVPDLASGSITIATNSKQPLPAPLIQYLPGPEGKTLMVADFEGVSYQLATHLLKPENTAADAWRQAGIQEIRIGQFSSNPPTMRISIASFNARAFRTLAFHARPGALVMKWTPGYPAKPAVAHQTADNYASRVKQAAVPAAAPWGVAPLAPDFKNSSQTVTAYGTTNGAKPAKEIAVRSLRKPAAAPEIQVEKLPEKLPVKLAEKPAAKLGAKTAAAEEASKWMAKETGSAVAAKTKDDRSVIYKSSEEASTAPSFVDANVSVVLNDVDQIKDAGAADLLIKADQKLNYKVFRLHEPERYVIDFDGLPALANVLLPSVADEVLVKGLRTGTPDDSGLTHRLVLDLKDNTVDVADELSDNGTTLSLKIRPSSSTPMAANLKQVSVKDKLIILDAGHGGSDPGAQRAGVSEKDLTLQITNQLKKRLTQLGARVVMTRSDDTFVSLEDRVKITNENQADLFVSIHINALESTSSIYGIETYYQTEQSRPLAAAIHQQLVEGLGVPDRSIRKARFYVINHTSVPAILAEVGFISNPKERDNLGAAEYQSKIADSVSAGILQYLTEKQELAGKTVKPPI
jgi:N-acetylmuramoyl-L-alanine amidase CwlD